MTDLNIIDQFMTSFISYIDSGFGLLGGEVHFLTTTLIGIDVTLAGLFWTMGGEDNILGRFIRKILYIGAFAYIIGNFSSLANVIYSSFVQTGITAGGGSMAAADLLKPGKLAGTGFTAAWPLLQQVSQLMGFTRLFDNFLTIAVLIFAWAIVIIAFFILAVQMFVCILEFKLTTLAGFILVPFALWNRTNFLAERVLGNIVSSGVKVMVLAVIVGIGSTFFSQLTSALQGQEPDIGSAMSLVLASLALLGLGIFGPRIASGLVAGAPQLGAGAAVGTAVGAAGIAAVGLGGGLAATRGALGAIRAGTAMGTAASTAWKMGQQAAGSSSLGAGLAGMGRAAGNAARQKASDTFGFARAAQSGRDAGRAAFEGTTAQGEGTAAASEDKTPAWARAMRRQQTIRHQTHIAIQALKEGDGGGAAANPDIEEKED